MNNTQKKIIDDKDDLGMIKDPALWPLYPILPVKNRQGKWKGEGGWPTLGTMVSLDPLKDVPKPIIYKESVDEVINAFQNDIDYKPTTLVEYPSLEELVADGWVVD